MSEERITTRTLGDVRDDRTDWKKLESMTEAEIEEAARSDPDAQPFDEEFLRQATILTPRLKKDIHMRVDEDVVEWFKKQGKGYQARMNAVLRAYMAARSTPPEDRLT